MLALPELGAEAPESVLIVRGEGGRDTLRDKLSERGVDVTYLDVYRRQIPADCCAQLASAIHSGLDAVCVASGETLKNLIACVSTPASKSLLELPLFVPSQRVAEIAKRMGFDKITVAANPADQGFTHSLIKWAQLQRSTTYE